MSGYGRFVDVTAGGGFVRAQPSDPKADQETERDGGEDG